VKVHCPYCGSLAELRDAFTVYKREGYGLLYVCPNVGCDAYVGVHNGTSKPKGSLADAELRRLRGEVHAVFDPLWRSNDEVDRTEVYEAAANVLGLQEFHIGEMRDDDAKAYLARHDELAELIRLQIQRNRLFKLSEVEPNLLSVLRYLYVDSQRCVRRVLSQNAYSGHVSLFKSAMKVGLVKRVKQRETERVYFALTPAGCSAIGIPLH